MAGKVLLRNSQDVGNLEEGDLIEFERSPVYSHWAVYIGNEEVVHLTGKGESRLPSNSGDEACVKKENIWDVAGDSQTYKNNLHDGKEEVLSNEEIVTNATQKIGKVDYNLILENCEHFATLCRYGKPISKQVQNFVAYGATGLALGGALACQFGGDSEK